MKRISICLGIIFLILFAGCPRRNDDASGRLRVTATLFVLYDFAREIGGNDTAVTLLLPPGIEAHMYEPTARDILSIKNAGVLLYGGKVMEPWAERVIASVKTPRLEIADASEHIKLLGMEEEAGHQEPAGPAADRHALDPHYWLDPVRALTVVDTIAAAFCTADPGRAEDYTKRAKDYKNRLALLDKKIQETMAGRKRSTVIFGGHNAFGYFAARYGLVFISPYTGFSPDAEPPSRRLVEMAALMRELDVTVIYHEENIDPKVARVLAESTGARLVMLHAVHNITKQELDAGASYISIMEANLAKLKADPGLF